MFVKLESRMLDKTRQIGATTGYEIVESYNLMTLIQ
jgi:hypothetical protein